MHLPPRCAEKYEPLETIGQGGFGVVLRCRHRELGREAAIKLLTPTVIGDGHQLERFRREARATLTLLHPGIVRLLDYDLDEDPPWLAYELIPGAPLTERLRDGAMPWEEALGACLQVLSALAESHRSGILHRDLKPDNILRRPDGSLTLIDFGLALSTGSDGGLTGTGVVLGTPEFLAPEVIRGEPPSPSDFGPRHATSRSVSRRSRHSPARARSIAPRWPGDGWSGPTKVACSRCPPWRCCWCGSAAAGSCRGWSSSGGTAIRTSCW